MHGLIHAKLEEYVETRHGADAWTAVLKEAGFADTKYSAAGAYPDGEAVAIVTAASKLTGIPAGEILEDFGGFIVPSLMAMYQVIIGEDWKTMEMLLHTEENLHGVVRIKTPNAEPPKLHFEQLGPDELKFRYDSPRGLVAVAKGIIKGVARHYGETAIIHDEREADGHTEMLITIQQQ